MRNLRCLVFVPIFTQIAPDLAYRASIKGAGLDRTPTFMIVLTALGLVIPAHDSEDPRPMCPLLSIADPQGEHYSMSRSI